jgi:hypothetical protein
MVAPRSMSMHRRDQSMDSKPNRNVQRLTLHVAMGTLAAALSSIFGGDFGTRAWVRYPFAANKSAASGFSTM